MAGLPGIAVPAGLDAQGLPLGPSAHRPRLRRGDALRRRSGDRGCRRPHQAAPALVGVSDVAPTVPVVTLWVWLPAAFDPVLILIAVFLGWKADQFGKVFIVGMVALGRVGARLLGDQQLGLALDRACAVRRADAVSRALRRRHALGGRRLCRPPIGQGLGFGEPRAGTGRAAERCRDLRQGRLLGIAHGHAAKAEESALLAGLGRFLGDAPQPGLEGRGLVGRLGVEEAPRRREAPRWPCASRRRTGCP